MTPMDLDLWILYATEGLSWDSKKRVRAEITAHVDDAFQSERAAGRPEEEAKAEALCSLGDPHEANRHFRKAYLLKREVNRIKYLREIHRFSFKDKLPAGAKWGIATLLSQVVLFILGIVGWVFFGDKQGLGDAPLSYLWLVATVWGFVGEKLRAHFLFTPVREGIEHRFKKAMQILYVIAVLGAIGPLSGYLAFQAWANAAPLPLAQLAAAMILPPLLAAGLYRWDCAAFRALLRKMREQEGKEEKPEWERYA